MWAELVKTKTLLVFGAKYILESFVCVETFLFFFLKLKLSGFGIVKAAPLSYL